MTAQGNRIILTPDRGYQIEGIVADGEEFFPGMVVQRDPSASGGAGNRIVHKIYDRTADGDFPLGPHVIVQEDIRQGKTVDDSYAAGERFFGFVPQPGCQLNLLFTTPSGTGTSTGSDVSKGDAMIVQDATGKVIVSTGTPEQEVAIADDSVNDVLADELLPCTWSGN